MADNAWFEERVSPARLAAFEDLVGAPDAPTDLYERQIWYWKRFVRALSPHTFQAEFEPARLGPRNLEPFQPIVRLEDLRTPLHDQGLTLEDLQIALRDHQAAVLDRFLERWNDARDHRPAFAAWKDEVLGELAMPDWPDALRDRLGLAHYDPTPVPVPVALMVYMADDVMREAAAGSVEQPFVAPTVLDCGPWPHFFPAPRELPYGRAMPLFVRHDETQLLAEMLHIRLTYRRHHLVRLGEIRRRAPTFDLKELRNHHLLCLQIAANRDDFGEEIA